MLFSARVYPGRTAHAPAQVVLVEDGRIAALGGPELLAAGAGHATRLVELPADALVLPGLCDSHVHLAGLAEAELVADLSAFADFAAVVREFAARAREAPPGTWLVGRGLDLPRLTAEAPLHHAPLSAVTPRHPVALRLHDGHGLLVNAEALARAGIERHTADPPGGRIVRRTEGGLPTGLLVDTAQDLVARLLPRPQGAALGRALQQALARCQQLGLTTVHDLGMDAATWETLCALDAAEPIGLRIVAYADWLAPGAETLLTVRPDPRTRGPLLRGVKFFADGALGSRGAALFDDYADLPGERGSLLWDAETLAQRIRDATLHGFQVATHAIGDRANRLVLDVYEQTLAWARGRGARPQDLRLRLEHAQVLHPSDLPRPGALGVVASVQPQHAAADAPFAAARLGQARLPGAYAYRALADAGARLCFGSDAPVAAPDPRLGLRAAVRDGGLRFAEALAGYTEGAAFSAFREQRAGVLAPGFDADFTVLAGDPAALPADDWPALRVLLTVVGGRVTYDGRG